jgi:iron complex outermembrane receptor protein
VRENEIGRTQRGSLRLAAVVASTLAAATVGAQEEEAAPAAATETRAGIEEIIVTAQRKEEALQDVPLSVTAVSADSLVARGVNSLSDLKPGTIPSVFFTQFAGTPSVLAINIRGVGLSDSTQGTQEMAVPVYIDGVFLGRGQGLGLDLIEPERVEVLRGPQGQLFGRNAEGGVVQYVSRKPSGEFDLKGSVSYGNYDDQRYRLALDLPSAGGFSTQVAAFKSRHDAYTPQAEREFHPGAAVPPGPHQDYGFLDASGFRGAIRWQNEGSFTADYAYDYSGEKDSQPYLTWVPVDIIGRDPVSPESPSKDYPEKTFEQLYNQPFRVRAQGHALTLAWDASEAITLKSITSYRETSRHGSSTLGTPLPAGVSSSGFIYTNAHEDIDAEQTSEELQFLGSWDQFDLTAGGIYYNEDIKDERRSYLTGPGFVGPVTFIQPPTLGFCVNRDPCLTSETHQEATTDSWGLYAQGTYRPAALDGRLELTAGLRYSDDSKDAKRTYNLTAGGPVNQKAEFSASRVDPAAIAKFNWTDEVQTYLRFATGYRAGGANVRSSTFTSYDEEENEAWELGMKSQFWDQRLQFNLALFYNTVKDEQLNIQEAPTTNPSLTNTANAVKDKKVKGAEIELFWAAMEGLGVGLNFSYMDADDFEELDNPYTETVVDPTRFYTLNVPETSGSVYLDYEQPIGVGKIALHTDYSYADDFWTTPGALLVSTLGPTYERPTADASQLAARLSWRDIELGGGTMEVALWGKNLLDDAAIIYGFDGCAFGGGFCAYRTPPRTYGLEVRFNY